MDGTDGVFVVFEGIDGAGTTTQAERFATVMRERKRSVHVTKEPSGGPIGSLLRLVLSGRIVVPSSQSAETMALLFAADRLDHVACELEPHLRDGTLVVSDRYDLSSIAYQSATAGERDGAELVRWIRELNRHARRPDVTLVIDTSPAVAAARRRSRGGARELFDDPDLQERLALAYRRAEEFVPQDRVIHVDGDGPVGAVTEAILEALLPLV